MSANSHFDRTLTDAAVMFDRAPGLYVANLAAPPVPVDRQSDRYQIYSRNDFGRDEFKPRAPGASAEILDVSMSSDTYYCDVFAGKMRMPHEIRDNSDDPAAYEQARVRMLMDGAALKRDRQFLAVANLNTSWTSTNRMVGHASSNASLNFIQFDATGGDPIHTVTRAHSLIRQGTNGRKGTVLVVGATLHDHFLTNDAVLERISYGGSMSNPAMITEQILAALFGVEKYLVAGVTYATNTEGATAAYADLMTDAMVLMYQSADKYAPTAIRQFSWTPYDDAKGSDSRVSIQRWEAEPDQHCTNLSAEIAMDFKVVSDTAGVHFADCLT